MAASFLRYSPPSTFSIPKPKIHLSSPSYRPIRASLSQSKTSWSLVNSEVEAHIEHALAGREPASVFAPMNHLAFDVPRSMAPALCIAACETVGGHKVQAISAASALHLMHVAAYTREFLQLSDQPKSDQLDHAFGPHVELLTADNMVQVAYEILAAMNDTGNTESDRIVQVTSEIARAMGSQGMINGQYIQLRCRGVEGEEPVEEGAIDESFEKKGGALYSCGAACGAILGGGSDEEIDKLRRYGLYVGMIHGIILHEKGVNKEKRLLKLAERLRFLALKELEGMKDKNVEGLCSIMDGFSAYLRVQKYHFPQRV